MRFKVGVTSKDGSGGYHLSYRSFEYLPQAMQYYEGVRIGEEVGSGTEKVAQVKVWVCLGQKTVDGALPEELRV